MGLTAHSTGAFAVDRGQTALLPTDSERVIALAGNPNVGKSTVFNGLTGMHQHTGNWSGKTVTGAVGQYFYRQREYRLVDIPGTYSLLAHSAEEEVARDFICFGGPDVTVVVCDATCLERNLNLVLQIAEVCQKMVVCVNLIDEAKKKKIRIDAARLQKNLGLPVVLTAARKKRGLSELTAAIDGVCEGRISTDPVKVRYLPVIETAIETVGEGLALLDLKGLPRRFVALKLLERDPGFCDGIADALGQDLRQNPAVVERLAEADRQLAAAGISAEALSDRIVSCIHLRAEEVCGDAVFYEDTAYALRDRRLDRFLTGRWTGYPVMILLLLFLFWLTVNGANLPSQLLADGLFWVQDRLLDLCRLIGMPDWLQGGLVLGVYRVVAWVVSVMLPPMAIFFPLFTLLEDLGYLPRIAFNLDHAFQRAKSCGKQALTLCMGFGCNAAGVVGCRIIDSPRERLIATITNSFVPCNGRFPILIALITMFFTFGIRGSLAETALAAGLLTAVILLSIGMTFLASRLLSQTVLRGTPSSFVLELPPYRRPQIGKVLLRSVLDRTLFVLGRAVVVAAPAGLLIWLTANISVGGDSLLGHCSHLLDPLGRLLGMDGVILMGFLLGFPANEIVLPIILMAYTATGTLNDYDSLAGLHHLLLDHGWSWVTALCTLLFSLFHWPCSTTCMTIYKETKSIKWTALSVALPTTIGTLLCFGVATVARLLGWG